MGEDFSSDFTNLFYRAPVAQSLARRTYKQYLEPGYEVEGWVAVT